MGFLSMIRRRQSIEDEFCSPSSHHHRYSCFSSSNTNKLPCLKHLKPRFFSRGSRKRRSETPVTRVKAALHRPEPRGWDWHQEDRMLFIGDELIEKDSEGESDEEEDVDDDEVIVSTNQVEGKNWHGGDGGKLPIIADEAQSSGLEEDDYAVPEKRKRGGNKCARRVAVPSIAHEAQDDGFQSNCATFYEVSARDNSVRLIASEPCLPRIVATPAIGHQQRSADTSSSAPTAIQNDRARSGWKESGDGIPVVWSISQ